MEESDKGLEGVDSLSDHHSMEFLHHDDIPKNAEDVGLAAAVEASTNTEVCEESAIPSMDQAGIEPVSLEQESLEQQEVLDHGTSVSLMEHVQHMSLMEHALPVDHLAPAMEQPLKMEEPLLMVHMERPLKMEEQPLLVPMGQQLMMEHGHPPATGVGVAEQLKGDANGGVHPDQVAATDADIVAMAGEAAVAAVEAGEHPDSLADGDTKMGHPKKEPDDQADMDASLDNDKTDYDMQSPSGDVLHMDDSGELDNMKVNARSSSDAGFDSAEKAAKRARRKSEPIKPFNDMLYELMAFRSREGHCRVPVDNKSALGRWVASLRSQYSSLQKGYPTADLTEERLMILRNIDFIWDLQQFDSDARWKRQFDELLAYKRENGHCNAPQSTPLGKWVKMQRENYRETQLRAQGTLPQNRTKPRPTLADERIAQLNSIGFQWKVAPPAAGWECRFEELVDYKRLHGDCNVPQAWPENRQLGRWVMKQRCQYTLRQKGERCQITDERIQRLNDLGFSWTAPSFRKNKKGEKEFDIRPKWL